jgi:hypothetical protein
MVLDIEHVPNVHERGIENTPAEARELFSTLLGCDFRVMLLVKVGIWTLWDEQGITETDVPSVSDAHWYVL